MNNKTKGIITTFNIEEFAVSVYLTNHAEKRMKKRVQPNISESIDEFVLASRVLALGYNVPLHCQNNDEIAIIDNDNGISLIAEFTQVDEKVGMVNIVTVMDKTDIYVKEGTAIKRIQPNPSNSQN